MKYLLPLIAAAGGAALIASPALAGNLPSPVPIAGAGLAALAGLGIGYRLLKRRIDR